ncbi:aspartate kinase [Alkaliphilus peptidifermentans]|uniref:Aspartokinase n=1 Tax=Alkaliphilus peptidifermentans DSM 18978 TaxID=1120976 RepID=A0A1G5I871_9FIRM|nr:aspartate kinase [Alkaliphilus peptidifermentans]SCY72233.1 aspartate kinase [Alkaliphilus peptidifermentans DSM 18978]
MNIVVQKFGGTSLSTKERREMVVDKILEAKTKGKAVVVVVSAIGRKGDPYATDSLRNLILADNPSCSLRTMDFLMSCGEMISASVLSALLEQHGEKVIVLNGAQAGILTDDDFSNAEIISIDEKKILSYLQEEKIVVICGFQGISQSGDITTLGRGGSDTTATALGVALNAEFVEIYTDVDGIMTADPNVVPTAKIIEEINYEEVFQMADKGAKVIHPRAVEIAQKDNLVVKIKNTMSKHPGTSIHHYRKNGESRYSTKMKEKLLTAITHKDSIAQVSIFLEDDLQLESTLLTTLAKNNISIDMINFFVNKKIFTIDLSQVPLLKKILNELELPFEIIEKCSKVTIIGNRITGIPGVMATIVSALSKEGIKILQSSDSHSTISCLVKEDEATRSVNILHNAFNLSV